jgi:8-oxo-dGTP pyrophosphatase MutT (NUDIX family)
MEFNRFSDQLEQIASHPSPGETAHEEIFPKIAKFRKEALAKNPDPKLSAVAAIFFPTKNDTSLLLIERQTYDGVHSGQIGFPGGKIEELDLSLEHTARRETQEEVGILGESLQLVRSLTEVYIPPSGFLVQPFLFTLKYTPELVLDPREVQSVLVMPLSKVLDDRTLVKGDIPTQGKQIIHTVYFEHENKKIWGATAMMLAELKILLKPYQ